MIELQMHVPFDLQTQAVASGVCGVFSDIISL